MPDLKESRSQYEGPPSTLCRGCGHDLISKAIVSAFHAQAIPPFQAAKISGIGCSSKTAQYFLKRSQGFNTIHGRMAPIAAGAGIANRRLKILGVSGDGDTGNIGLGSFLHAARRNTPMIYIVENNGVYGLTKGQLSATAEKGSQSKGQGHALAEGLDLASLAIEAGAPFVARGFSGDLKQLQALLRLALKCKGFAFLDIISPCVIYGNDKAFGHSFHSAKARALPLNEIDLIDEKAPIQKETPEQKAAQIPLHDGSFLTVKKIRAGSGDISSEEKALSLIQSLKREKAIPTGLLFYKERESLHERLRLSEIPLASISMKRPGREAFLKILGSFA